MTTFEDLARPGGSEEAIGDMDSITVFTQSSPPFVHRLCSPRNVCVDPSTTMSETMEGQAGGGVTAVTAKVA